jgi:hypothetical protein
MTLAPFARLDHPTRQIWFGSFPKADVAKGLSYISDSMPEGPKKILIADSESYYKNNGFTELVLDIVCDFETQRLFIIEVL